MTAISAMIASAQPIAAVIISVALMLFFGFAMTRITKLLRLPNVTAYIVAGILLGPYCLGLVPQRIIDGTDFLSDIALAFIAFSVGEFFKLSTLKKSGLGVIVITLLEACMASVFVFVLTYFALGLDLAFCAVLAALALALSYMESFFPLALIVPLPGVKLGLANIVTLYALYALGFPSALAILLVRCTLGALFAGNASALLFSLLGGLSALFVMALLSGAKKLSIFGVSIAGAAAHNCGQVCAALITLGSTAPLYYLPFLLLVSLFTGALSGLITAFLFRAMAHTPYGTKGENEHG